MGVLAMEALGGFDRERFPSTYGYPANHTAGEDRMDWGGEGLRLHHMLLGHRKPSNRGSRGR